MARWIEIQDALIDLEAFDFFAIRLRYDEETPVHQFLVTGARSRHPHVVDIALYDARPEAEETLARLKRLLLGDY